VTTNSPEVRQGHSSTVIGNKLLIYGGWSADSQFSDIWLFDTETYEWTDADIPFEYPRWNHTTLMVEAIPSWKYFIFGGS